MIPVSLSPMSVVADHLAGMSPAESPITVTVRVGVEDSMRCSGFVCLWEAAAYLPHLAQRTKRSSRSPQSWLGVKPSARTTSQLATVPDQSPALAGSERRAAGITQAIHSGAEPQGPVRGCRCARVLK